MRALDGFAAPRGADQVAARLPNPEEVAGDGSTRESQESRSEPNAVIAHLASADSIAGRSPSGPKRVDLDELERAAGASDLARRRPGDGGGLGRLFLFVELAIDPRRAAPGDRTMPSNLVEHCLRDPAALFSRTLAKQTPSSTSQRRFCRPAASVTRSARTESGPRKARPRKTMRTFPVRTYSSTSTGRVCVDRPGAVRTLQVGVLDQRDLRIRVTEGRPLLGGSRRASSRRAGLAGAVITGADSPREATRLAAYCSAPERTATAASRIASRRLSSRVLNGTSSPSGYRP